jgi:hypothetical protein
VIGLWLVAAATAWWTAPRQATYEQATADIRAQQVTGYEWGDRWRDERARPWFSGAVLESSGTLGPLFVWRTGSGRLFWADTADFDEVRSTGALDEQAYSGIGAVGIAQDLRAAGAAEPTGIEARGRWADGIGIALALIFIVVLLAGPAPVHGTRWFWWWLVVLTPYGLGLLFWLARDRPWSRSPEVADGRPRDRGILGFGLGLFATFLINIVLLLLNGALGDRWVPVPT